MGQHKPPPPPQIQQQWQLIPNLMVVWQYFIISFFKSSKIYVVIFIPDIWVDARTYRYIFPDAFSPNWMAMLRQIIFHCFSEMRWYFKNNICSSLYRIWIFLRANSVIRYWIVKFVGFIAYFLSPIRRDIGFSLVNIWDLFPSSSNAYYRIFSAFTYHSPRSALSIYDAIFHIFPGSLGLWLWRWIWKMSTRQSCSPHHAPPLPKKDTFKLKAWQGCFLLLITVLKNTNLFTLINLSI